MIYQLELRKNLKKASCGLIMIEILFPLQYKIGKYYKKNKADQKFSGSYFNNEISGYYAYFFFKKPKKFKIW